jgi:HEAT repeat protein
MPKALVEETRRAPSEMERRLASLRAGGFAEPEQAVEEVIAGWKTWTDADLAALAAAAADANRDVAERAARAIDTIRARRALGERMLSKIRALDEAVLGDRASEHSRVLASAAAGWRRGELSDAELAALASIAAARRWALTPSKAAELVGRSPPVRPYAPLLVALMGHADPVARRAASAHLAAAGMIEQAGEIAALLRDRDEAVRAAAAEHLVLLDAREHVEAVGRLLRDPEAGVRLRAALAYAALGGKASSLEPLLRDASPEARAGAAEAIGLAGGARAAALAGALKDDDARVREAAAKAVGRLAPKEAEKMLAPLLEDKEVRVRAAAARSLGRAGVGDAALKGLTALEKEAPVEKGAVAGYAAVAALVRLGTKTRPQQRALVAGLARLKGGPVEGARGEVLEAIAAANAKERWATLDVAIRLNAPVTTAEEAVEALRRAGVTIESARERLGFTGRIAARSATPRELLTRITPPGSVWVPDGRGLRLMSADEAAMWWGEALR